MKNIALLLTLLVGFFCSSVQAASLVQSKMNCAEILERWANDPNSVPKALVDECKGVKGMATAAPVVIPFAGAPDESAAIAAADPCAGPDAGASVHCWGPWSLLAPAAAGTIDPPIMLAQDGQEQRPELAELYDVEGEFLPPRPTPFGPNDLNSDDPPTVADDTPPIVDVPGGDTEIPNPPVTPQLGGCQLGQPCGFATIVAGGTSQAPSDETTLVRFDYAGDGGQFIVAPGASEQVASTASMTTRYVDRPDEYENMQADGADGNSRSLVIARVIRNDNGEITTAADVWANRTEAGEVQSGYFAWGRAISAADLDVLNNGSGVSAVFSGPMSVDNATTAQIRVDFGTRPAWAGAWTNPGYAFEAGGTLVGADLVSDAARFSSNVGADSYVRGVLLGQAANKSIAHVINVDLAGVGRIKDVGLLRE